MTEVSRLTGTSSEVANQFQGYGTPCQRGVSVAARVGGGSTPRGSVARRGPWRASALNCRRLMRSEDEVLVRVCNAAQGDRSRMRRKSQKRDQWSKQVVVASGME
ncbi:MAG: hypothetical protein KatS3mg077_0561 [Candidatus Binatia bacterium]|nr:MAG: hypothetical protein KatS3mg077_0561 [Candidatus Binatia bacterium]